ncbi:MAG: hypothetical protein HC862_06225 [Scytonema sp. RU_4_4]|nr:hypothetical protein [Scytonema sp. RU_4_4]NJR73390.1 hypothetical protein [Scytonema sp. CRU_2_7]
MKYPILPSAEDGVSPNSTSTRTVLFVFRVSRFIRRCLSIPVYSLVLLRVHRQNLASRKVITLRTTQFGVCLTAYGRASDRVLSPNSALWSSKRLTATYGYLFRDSWAGHRPILIYNNVLHSIENRYIDNLLVFVQIL